MTRAATMSILATQGIASLLLPAVLFAGDAPPPPADEPAPAAALTVLVQGVPSEEGLLQVGLYVEETFPEGGEYLLGIALPAQAGAMTARFDAVPPGTYAVAIYHDTNSNNVLDTNLFGVPKEDYAFSNNARAAFGPPKFERASFVLRDDTALTIDLD